MSSLNSPFLSSVVMVTAGHIYRSGAAGGSSALPENEAGPTLRECVCVRECVAGTSACRAHPDAELDSIQLPKWQIHSPLLSLSTSVYLSNCPLSLSLCSLPLSLSLFLSFHVTVSLSFPHLFPLRLSYLKSRLLHLKTHSLSVTK